MPESNASLAQRAGTDPGALAVLMTRHQAAVFDVCLRWLQHRQDAEDVTQETLVRATKYIDRFDPGRPFAPWLITIAVNRCRTLLSQRTHCAALTVVSEPICDDTRLERDASTLQEELSLALTKLPKNQRRAFELFHRDGLEYVEIASRMRCPQGTAKTWVHRARQRLIDELRQRDVITTDSPRTESSGSDSSRTSNRSKRAT